jgi:N-acetylglutamate synthase-like GNAT family acetyltransferase
VAPRRGCAPRPQLAEPARPVLCRAVCARTLAPVRWPDLTPPVIVRVASATERPEAESFYRADGYTPSVAPSDQVFIALANGSIVGITRLCSEHDCLVLRGMRVKVEFRRRGIASALLRAAMVSASPRVCYCLPFTHLVELYGREGFLPVPIDSLPTFLRDRARRYEAKGEATSPMCRSAGTLAGRWNCLC